MIVVTGATGFIGQRLVSLLVKKHKPKEICCLVWNKNTPKEVAGRKFLKKLGVKIEKIDLLDKNGLMNLSQTPRLVFHLAATTDTALSDHSCNDVGTSNLVEALRPNKKTHFVHVGTSAMYCGRVNCRKPINERSKPVPSNKYGRSKLKAEKILKEEAGKRGFSLTILRPPTVYGSNPRDNSLFDFLKKLILVKSPLARLDWPGLTSLVWVDDMARVIFWAAEHSPKPGNTSEFLVSAEALTLADISRLMHEGLGLKYRKISLPEWLWQIGTRLRRIIYAFDGLLPPQIYNLPWRASLVMDDVLFCDASKLIRSFPAWRPSLFKNKIDEVL